MLFRSFAGIGQDDLAGDRAHNAQEDPVTGLAPRHLPAGEPGQGGLSGLARPQDEPVAQRRRPPRRRRGEGRGDHQPRPGGARRAAHGLQEPVPLPDPQRLGRIARAMLACRL